MGMLGESYYTHCCWWWRWSMSTYVCIKYGTVKKMRFPRDCTHGGKRESRNCIHRTNHVHVSSLPKMCSVCSLLFTDLYPRKSTITMLHWSSSSSSTSSSHEMCTYERTTLCNWSDFDPILPQPSIVPKNHQISHSLIPPFSYRAPPPTPLLQV